MYGSSETELRRATLASSSAKRGIPSARCTIVSIDAVVDTDRGQPAHEVPHLIVRQGFDRNDVDELGDGAVAGCRVGALGEEDQYRSCPGRIHEACDEGAARWIDPVEVLHHDDGMAKILHRGEHDMQGQLDDRMECAL